jgi:hypothetical protein
MVPRGRTMRLVSVLMLALLVALPLSSAYLNESINMKEYVEDGTCYCHGAIPAPDVNIVIDVPEKVAYTPDNDTVDVSIGILGEPDNLTAFGLFLNASKDASDVKWTKAFSNDTKSWTDATTRGVIEVNGTSLWTTGPVTSPWFNVSFVPGQTDQKIVLTVTGMRADENGNETGDYWNVGQVTITVREQRLVSLSVGITNRDVVDAISVLVDFYMDGEYIGNNTVGTIPGGATENATVDWDATFEEEGAHKLRAVIDPEGHITESDKSDNEVVQTIWLGGPPEETDYTLYYGLGSMAVGVVVIVVAFWFWRRRQYRF